MSISMTLLLVLLSITKGVFCNEQCDAIQMARTQVMNARTWFQGKTVQYTGLPLIQLNAALNDCDKLYDEADYRLNNVLAGADPDDARAWVSAALTNHKTCLDGLTQKGFPNPPQAQNLTKLLSNSLAFFSTYGHKNDMGQKQQNQKANNVCAGDYGSKTRKTELGGAGEGLLASWNATTSKADFVVAKDNTGNFNTVSDAVNAVAKMGKNRRQRVIIYVKSGVYRERIDIPKGVDNIMLVGDGIDRTIVTFDQSVLDGSTTYNSATFGVSGDGFWARDMTFENTAGPHKHQAVALTVKSDLSIFYRCSMRGYQDTLFAHSLRQFYRDCQIYGTIDFIFGNAAAVFQNCDILVRRPMDHQSNMITAQGREDQGDKTGFSIQNSRVLPAPEFGLVKNTFRTYLGRPWKRFSRTVFLKTNLDGLVDPRGWEEWNGDYALSTLYYAEYMNSGPGSSLQMRVRWPGFHVLHGPTEASPFTVRAMIEGDVWIPESGIPFWSVI